VIVYVDASALAKRYVREAETETVNLVLESELPVISRLTEVEVVSALARRCREGALPAGERDRALEALRRDLATLHVVEITAPVARLGCELLLRHALRAGDALQLAACLFLRDSVGRPVAFLAYDDRLGRAAAAEGLELLAP